MVYQPAPCPRAAGLKTLGAPIIGHYLELKQESFADSIGLTRRGWAKSVVVPEEVISMSTAFKRWQDWTIIAIGIVVVATPFVFSETSNHNAAYSAYFMGALVVLAGLLGAFMATPLTSSS